MLLEFHVDDTADDKEDTLVEMAFHVPGSNEHWGSDQQQGADGEDTAAVPPAKVGAVQLISSCAATADPCRSVRGCCGIAAELVDCRAQGAGSVYAQTFAVHVQSPCALCHCLQALLEALLQYTDAGVATSADAVITFEEVAILAPRGRYQVEMHASFLKLVGQVRQATACAVYVVREGVATRGLAGWSPGGRMACGGLFWAAGRFSVCCILRWQTTGSCLCRASILTAPTNLMRMCHVADTRLQDPLHLHQSSVHPAQEQHAPHTGGGGPGPTHPQGTDILLVPAVPGEDWVPLLTHVVLVVTACHHVRMQWLAFLTLEQGW